MKQLNQKEWRRGNYEPSLVLPKGWKDLEEEINFVFEDGEEDGLGPVKIADAEMKSGRQVSFECLYGNNESETIVYSLFDPKPDNQALSDMLYELKISSELLIWQSPLIEHHHYKLYRLDDNNNEFLVGRFQWESDAKLTIDRLTQGSHRKGSHKQHYWIEQETKSRD